MNTQTASMRQKIALENAAMQDLKTNVLKAKVGGNKIIAIEELQFTGNENSKVITIEISNANVGVDYDLVFGTPVGISGEYAAIPFSSTLANIMFTGLADLSDNQGAGLAFLQMLNKRFVRNSVFVSHIEVITPDTATGSSQRSIAPRKFIVPYNSYSDSASIQGNYVPQWTQFTAISMLEKGYVLGEFSGFSYTILRSSSVKLNIHLAAINTPTFMYKG